MYYLTSTCTEQKRNIRKPNISNVDAQNWKSNSLSTIEENEENSLGDLSDT